MESLIPEDVQTDKGRQAMEEMNTAKQMNEFSEEEEQKINEVCEALNPDDCWSPNDPWVIHEKALRQQIETLIDTLIVTANDYIDHALPPSPSHGQNASDRSEYFCQVQELLIRALAAIRFHSKPSVLKPEKIGAVIASLQDVYSDTVAAFKAQRETNRLAGIPDWFMGDKDAWAKFLRP